MLFAKNPSFVKVIFTLFVRGFNLMQQVISTVANENLGGRKLQRRKFLKT